MTAAQFLELAASLSLQAALIVTVAWWLQRRTPAHLHCRLWTACYLVLLLLTLAALVFPHARLVRPWGRGPAASLAGTIALERQAGWLLAAVWLTGGLLSLGRFLYGMVQSWRFVRSCGRVADDDLSVGALLGDPAAGRLPSRRSGSSAEVHLLSSPMATSPFCWQFHRPYIVLPDFLLSSDRSELRFIVRHELEHLRKGDPLQLFLQRSMDAVFWFHPWVWWASRHASLAREFACDAAAVSAPQEVTSYLRALLSVVERGSEAGRSGMGDAGRGGAGHVGLAFSRQANIIALRARRLTEFAQGTRRCTRLGGVSAGLGMIAVSVLAMFVWLPVDATASARSNWSPWPRWSAGVLHDFGISARDFEIDGYRLAPHELEEHGPARQ